MEQLRDQFNVPSYSVHDSLIVPRDFKDQATQLLKSNFELAFAVPFRFS
jgi:ATP adenylyltransferase/5',5'''-P-1,P-4-tetraphosphate phosphorylase II